MSVVKRRKILIIKLGYSETVDRLIHEHTSYGDVLRSTVLLHLYKGDHVTWLTDEKAMPILEGNPYIDRVLKYNLTSALQLFEELFDVVINLEKIPGICALANSVCAHDGKFGFGFENETGEAMAHNGSEHILELCQNDASPDFEYNEPIQKGLYEMVGAEWTGEEYVLGWHEQDNREFSTPVDVGLNWATGNKFEGKAWSESNWGVLRELLVADKIGHRTQAPHKGLHNYFRWIDACKVLVTNDSFGLHLALAMGKQVVGLFGATNPNQVYMYGRGIALRGDNIDDIAPAEVLDAVKGLLSG